MELPTFITLSDADAMAAALPLFARYKASADIIRPQLLAMASLRINSSRRWQGRKYDSAQVLEFPRVPYPNEPIRAVCAFPAANSNLPPGGVTVWDWDATNAVAVIPQSIQLATLYEADSIAVGERDRIAAALSAGLTGMTTGDASEQYRQMQSGQAGIDALCRDAELLVSRYGLRTGSIR